MGVIFFKVGLCSSPLPPWDFLGVGAGWAVCGRSDAQVRQDSVGSLASWTQYGRWVRGGGRGDGGRFQAGSPSTGRLFLEH